jgi:WD40 repeat protein
LAHQRLGARCDACGHLRTVNRVAFTHGGAALVSSSYDGTVHTWTVRSPAEELGLKGHTNAVYSAVTSNDCATLATTSGDGSVRFWDLQSGRGIALDRSVTGPVYDMAFGPLSGQFVLNAWDKQLELWRFQPSARLGVFHVPHDKVQGLISFDGQFVLENNNAALQIIEVRSKSIVQAWEAPPMRFRPTVTFPSLTR